MIRRARTRWAAAALFLAGAYAYLSLGPWHGPVVVSLSEQHGVDAADLPALPLIAVALLLLRPRVGDRAARTRWGGRGAAICAIGLGLLLMVGILDPRIGSPLVAAGGGTFGGDIDHVDGVRGEPVGRWTHLAVTYDGRKCRLYVNGERVSSAPWSGTIRKTGDPLWIGGNRPYGEYFQGTIDEVRVYRRALPPAEVRAAMATPLGRRDGPETAGLVAAYPFDGGAGHTADDASGNANAGAIRGAEWTTAGRFGAGLRFGGTGELVRIPASASLDLERAMTLMAWIKPSESQSGWRTIVARQRDAYYLAAGGGRQDAGLLERLDRVRFAVTLLLLVALGLALALDRALRLPVGRPWYWPLALFIGASLADAAFAGSDTLIGPALLAAWGGAVWPRHRGRIALYALATAFAGVTALAVLDPDLLHLPLDAGGVVRAAALGLILIAVTLPGLLCKPMLAHRSENRPA